MLKSMLGDPEERDIGAAEKVKRQLLHAKVIDVWEANKEKPPLRLVGECF